MGKKAKKETALTKKISDDAPAWIVPVAEDEVVAGLENMRPGDLLIPRLILLQGLSPQVAESDNKSGQIINSLTGDVWIEREKTEIFIPIYHYLEWIQWGDRETGEGILARSLNPAGELAQMAMRAAKRTTNQGVEVFIVTEYHNFISVFPEIDLKSIVVISCAKTNIKKGKKLLGLARFRGRFPLYAGKYEISAILETNRVGQKYNVFEFANAGWVEKDMYAELSKLYELMKDAFTQRKLLAHQAESKDSDEPQEEEM